MDHLPLSDKEILAHTLRDLTQYAEREELLLMRAVLEVDNTTWSDDEKEIVRLTARDAVEIYHKGEKRDDHTFATHVLRVANRIVSPNHFNHRNSPNLIKAALLHDVVENCPERLLGEEKLPKSDITGRITQQKRALDAIADMYGQEVADMVAAVSNEIYDKTRFSDDERQEKYRDQVIKLMKSGSDARYIKLSDFIDNCLGLEYNPEVDKRAKLARKYQPLIPYMLRFALSSDLSAEVKRDIEAELIKASTLCELIIASKGSVQKLGTVLRPQKDVEVDIAIWRSHKDAA